MPESGAWQPKTVGAQRRAAEDLVEQRQLHLAVALAAEFGAEVAGPQALVAAPSAAAAAARPSTSRVGLVVRVAEHEVERLDLVAHELVDPVELRLVLGIGLEVPHEHRVYRTRQPSGRPVPMKTHLNCPCGESIVGTDEDDLVEKTQKHLAENHPGHEYSRDEILFIAF